LAPLKE
jgi:hypothetical protein